MPDPNDLSGKREQIEAEEHAKDAHCSEMHGLLPEENTAELEQHGSPEQEIAGICCKGSPDPAQQFEVEPGHHQQHDESASERGGQQW